MRCCSGFVSLCCRKTASSLSASRCALGAPPRSPSTRSNSCHDQPSLPLGGHSVPAGLRSMTAGSKRLSPLGRSMPTELRRTASADDVHRIHAIRAEPERPQQSRREHLSVHFTVVAAELDLHLVVAPDDARELRGQPIQFLVAVVAHDSGSKWEGIRTCRPGLEILRADIRRSPHARARDDRCAGVVVRGRVRRPGAKRRARSSRAGDQDYCDSAVASGHIPIGCNKFSSFTPGSSLARRNGRY